MERIKIFIKALFRSVRLAGVMLYRQGMGDAFPVFVFLLLLSVVLAVVSAVSPLVPFVYSLF